MQLSINGLILRPAQSGLHNSVRADAGSADSQPFDRPIHQAAHRLEIRAEDTLRVLHDVHANAALLLCQTTTRDVTADRLVLAANIANTTHG